MIYSLYTDGGSRGNPGPGAIGIVIKNEDGSTVFEEGKYLGVCTNNEAEYVALFQGLKAARSKNIENLAVYMDSELIVKQMNGSYKVKNDRLKQIYLKIKDLEKSFQSVSFTHVKRELNKRADALVNKALDNNGK